MWTSGSRQVGSWMEATDWGARTVTGMDCVMVVSRSWGKGGPAWLGRDMESSLARSTSLVMTGFEASEGSRELLAFSRDTGGRKVAQVVVRIVRESRGMLSFFVRRIEADVAAKADLRARFKCVRET